MATVTIFHEEDGSTSTVSVNLNTSILSTIDSGATPAPMTRDSYLLISTTLRKVDGSTFGTYMVRDLTDVAPGASSPASDFTALVNGWIEYFVDQAELGQSSSDSSSSYSTSSSSSDSTSSSSSDGNSNSSSSSEGNSNSSSSQSNSSSSQSNSSSSQSNSSSSQSESSSSESESSSSQSESSSSSG